MESAKSVDEKRNTYHRLEFCFFGDPRLQQTEINEGEGVEGGVVQAR